MGGVATVYCVIGATVVCNVDGVITEHCVDSATALCYVNVVATFYAHCIGRCVLCGWCYCNELCCWCHHILMCRGVVVLYL